ncbi:hypothetical protein [Hymenobacter saemangeumensis]|uniref:hypothetical protein n=1 Tax=Hymenobacter saemangeumensis TaxID=1084522 RepID=UPI0031F138D9
MVAVSLYFSNAVGSVDFVPGSYVYLHWTGADISSVEFRALYVHVYNLLKRHELKGILADHRAMPAAPPAADRDWLLNEWLPKALAETGLARYAVLPMPDPAQRLHTDSVIGQLRQSLETAFFDDVDPAAAWLMAAE